MNRWLLPAGVVLASALTMGVFAETATPPAVPSVPTAPTVKDPSKEAKAAAKEATKEAKEATKEAKGAAEDATKLTGEYGKLTGLTADQKAKILVIQTELKEKIKKAEEEADTKVEAILTPEQQAQLDTIQGEAKVKQRQRAKAYREKLKAGGEKVEEKKAN